MSGYSTRSNRMKGAHEAIKSIVTDSSLISSVNFGFGYWSSQWMRIYYSRGKTNRTRVRCSTLVAKGILSSSSWLVRRNYWCSNARVQWGYTRWGKNQAVPCTSQNCLKVRVDRDGARRTFTEVSRVRPGGGTDANIWATIAEQYYNHASDSPIDKNSPCQGS